MFSLKDSSKRPKNKTTVAEEVGRLKSVKKEYYEEKLKLEAKKVEVYERSMLERNRILSKILLKITESKSSSL